MNLRAVGMGCVVALLFVPVVTDSDDFPLSTYPMYSRSRPSEVSFVTASGIDETGARRDLSLGIIGASDDPLVVAGELRAAIRDGRAAERCDAIARRTADADRFGIDEIEIVTERHNVIDRVEGRASLLDRTVHARCSIDRVDP